MMKFTQSIRFRIVVACVLFALVVSIILGALVALTMRINADEQFNWHTQQEMNYFLKRYEENKNVQFDLARGKVIVGNEDDAIEYLDSILTQESKDFMEKSLNDIPTKRFHKTFDNGYTIYYYDFKENEIYILKAPIKNKKLNMYYFIELTGFDFTDNMGANIAKNYFFFMVIIILVLSIFIGFYIAKKVLIPLTNLTSNVDKIDIGEYKSNTKDYYNDEIGFLARKIDSFVKRTAEFVQREKAFTRDASHELRTPVASSQAALDVAYALPEGQSPTMQKVLARIQRANKNMIHLIESFLILGRETQKNRKKQTFNLKELVDSSINKNLYLLTSQEIHYENRVHEELMLTLHKEYLLIVIDNLIRNAFVHMQEGNLNVGFKDNTFVVHDSGEWFNENKEMGIGLNIVTRICKEENWKLAISTKKGLGTKIEIVF